VWCVCVCCVVEHESRDIQWGDWTQRSIRLSQHRHLPVSSAPSTPHRSKKACACVCSRERRGSVCVCVCVCVCARARVVIGRRVAAEAGRPRPDCVSLCVCVLACTRRRRKGGGKRCQGRRRRQRRHLSFCVCAYVYVRVCICARAHVGTWPGLVCQTFLGVGGEGVRGRGRRVNGASNTRKEGKQGSGQGSAVTGLPCILSLVRALTRHAVDVCA